MIEPRRKFIKKMLVAGLAAPALPRLLLGADKDNADKDNGDCHPRPALDFAKTQNMDAWLRHPVLGDPSFDTFEKLGRTVHQSEPPHEWAVNGSLFCDPADGAWYYYAGLYGKGYNTNTRMTLKIYKSADGGATWQDLGGGFPPGFCFDGHSAAADHHTDAVMTYDPETKLYWLAYDWLTNEGSWATIHHPAEKKHDSGAALAWAKNPAGPFTRLSKPIFGNHDISRKLGRFSRAYATTVLKRKSDWIALTLCDSREYYSWGLACFTADSPDGVWSGPKILLSVDRPEYYPAPVEFYPCFVAGETVHAPATSVALNRNYQTMHTAPLEQAHNPDAWALTGDGNAWHARPLPDEKYGIWGQTYHGFVDKAGGKLTVMYPSRDERGFGTLSVAQRPWGQPHGDGFTFSGHEAKSLSPLTQAYKKFTLEMEFAFTGTIEIAFDYNGLLGPERPAANAGLGRETLSDYKALRLSGGNFQFVSVNQSGEAAIVCGGEYPSGGKTMNLSLSANDRSIDFKINGVAKNISGVSVKGGPLALIAHEFSILTCSKYAVSGEQIPCLLRYHSHDALLGAGQRLKDWKKAALSGLSCISEKAVINAAEPSQSIKIYGKWNVICSQFTIHAPKSPALGIMQVLVDGEYKASVDLYSEDKIASSPVYSCEIASGRHGIALHPEKGEIVLDVLEVKV